MKTGQSTDYPLEAVSSNGFLQIRYDIVPFVKEMMDTTMNGFNYSYIEIAGDITKGKIIDAIIMNTYSKDAEIALINDEIITPGGTQKYIDYQALRVHAKDIALHILENNT